VVSVNYRYHLWHYADCHFNLLFLILYGYLLILLDANLVQMLTAFQPLNLLIPIELNSFIYYLFAYLSFILFLLSILFLFKTYLFLYRSILLNLPQFVENLIYSIHFFSVLHYYFFQIIYILFSSIIYR